MVNGNLNREVFQRCGEGGAAGEIEIEEGDLILFAADEWLNACEILGKIRLYASEKLVALVSSRFRRINSTSCGLLIFRCLRLIRK